MSLLPWQQQSKLPLPRAREYSDQTWSLGIRSGAMESIGVSPTAYLAYHNSSLESELLSTLTQHPPPWNRTLWVIFAKRQTRERGRGCVAGSPGKTARITWCTHVCCPPLRKVSTLPAATCLYVRVCMSSLQWCSRWSLPGRFQRECMPASWGWSLWYRL